MGSFHRFQEMVWIVPLIETLSKYTIDDVVQAGIESSHLEPDQKKQNAIYQMTYRIPKEKYNLLSKVIENSKKFCYVRFNADRELVDAQPDVLIETGNE